MRRAVLTLAALLALASPALADEDAAHLYAENCAACHGGDRLGAIGPALLPENLGRLKKAEAVKVITEGRPATQMPAHGGKLSPDQIKALADYVFTPLPKVPDWGLKEITATHVRSVIPERLPGKPVFSSDPLNLFTVVETGDHHVTILDGDHFKPLARFQSRFALHGGAKYSPDGRFVYLMSRDGWVSMYDLYTLQMVAEVRAGVNSRNIAVSHDGRFVMVGNNLPHSLVALDARDLTPIKVIPVAEENGASSRVSAVYTAPERGSFVVALKDIKEIWEIPTKDGFAGEVAIRRIKTPDYLDDFFFDATYRHVMGASRDGHKGLVMDLDAGKPVATIDLPGMPHLGSGILFAKDGHEFMATPHLKEAVISVIDMTTWQTVKRIPTLGPGFFMRSHENTPYAWIDVSMGKEKDAIQVIDLRSLEIVKTLRPAPGRTTAHAEFDRSGKHVLISVMEDDGELIVYDSASFEVVARLPMKRPVGKYNVWNKINFSSGTSH